VFGGVPLMGAATGRTQPVTLERLHVPELPRLAISPDMPKLKTVRDYSGGSIRSQFARCRTPEEVKQMAAEINQAIAGGLVTASSGTLRNLSKAASSRLRAINRASLLDAQGNPIL
jgi:hypothetical protein